MVYKATKEVQKAFERKGLKCRIQETGNLSFVEAGYTGDNVSGMIVRFISGDNDPDVSVRVLNYIKGPESKRAALLEACNSMNKKFRYVKFCLDEDCSIDLEIDLPVTESDPGGICTELFARVSKIADGAYPDLMKVVWNG